MAVLAIQPLGRAAAQNPFSETTRVGITFGDEALKRPNATGHFSIGGFDISKPYSPDNTINGWTLDINVTADVAGHSDNGFVTAAAIKLSPPAALVTQPGGSLRADNASWALCLSVLGSLSQSTKDAGRSDDGSCVAMFGQKCVDDILAGWGDGWGSRPNPTRLPCPSFPIPKSCRDGPISQSDLATIGRFRGACRRGRGG